jgi:hypothetical protein
MTEMIALGVFNDDEKRIADKLKNLDFGKFSFAHKDRLWQELNTISKSRSLTEDELDAVAAGVNQDVQPKKPEE